MQNPANFPEHYYHISHILCIKIGNLVMEERLCTPFSTASEEFLPKFAKQAFFKERNTEKNIGKKLRYSIEPYTGVLVKEGSKTFTISSENRNLTQLQLYIYIYEKLYEKE